jgi:hypothetical protein
VTSGSEDEESVARCLKIFPDLDVIACVPANGKCILTAVKSEAP